MRNDRKRFGTTGLFYGGSYALCGHATDLRKGVLGLHCAAILFNLDFGSVNYSDGSTPISLYYILRFFKPYRKRDTVREHPHHKQRITCLSRVLGGSFKKREKLPFSVLILPSRFRLSCFSDAALIH